MKPEASHFEETQAISLRLVNYDDLFSDFDIRPYSKRVISVDFLDEIKRAVSDREEGAIELLLHVPEKERSESQEATIKERIEEHFKRHYHLFLKEKTRVLKLGAGMVILGVISMIIATLLVFDDPTENVVRSFLVVFLEPAAWFLLWEGMDQIIFNSRKIKPELDFYRKMYESKGHVHFKSY